MHAGVYQTRADVNAIVHTHQVYASALALIAAHPGAVRRAGALSGPLGRDHPLRALGHRLPEEHVASASQHNNAYILQNHGVLVLRRTTWTRRATWRSWRSARWPICWRCDRAPRYQDPAADPRDRLRQAARDQKKLSGSSRRRRDAEPLAPGTGAECSCRQGPAAPPNAGRRLSRRYAICAYPDADRVYARLKELVSQPLRPINATGDGGVPRLLRDEVPAQQALIDEAGRAHPRRRAAQPGLQLSVPARRSRKRRGRATCGTSTATATSTSCRPAARPCWAATTRRCARRSSSSLHDCGPVTGLFHEYELKLAELINRFMPVDRDVPHARLAAPRA